jgi:hypothetical protein
LDNCEEYGARADYPIARGRFHDLLWERRHGVAHVDAAEAACAYLELTRGRRSRIYNSFCVMRAFELAWSINHPELLGESMKRSIELISEDLADEEWCPGIAGPLLTQLAGLPPDLRQKEATQLIETAGGRYGAEPFIAESISQLKARLSHLRNEKRSGANKSSGGVRAQAKPTGWSGMPIDSALFGARAQSRPDRPGRGDPPCLAADDRRRARPEDDLGGGQRSC